MSLPILIFDMDDTLVQSFPSYATLHQRVAGDLGWNVPTVDELVPYGHDWTATLNRLFPERELAPFMRRYEEVAHEHPYEAIAGTVATLEELRRRGHALFIVTKRDTSRLAARLAEAKIDPDLFDAIFPREAQPVTKPSPRCFEPVWKHIGVESGTAFSPLPIYIGDREEDRLAATAAGIRFLAVLTGPEVRLGFPEGVDPKDALRSIAYLPAWLDRA